MFYLLRLDVNFQGDHEGEVDTHFTAFETDNLQDTLTEKLTDFSEVKLDSNDLSELLELIDENEFVHCQEVKATVWELDTIIEVTLVPQLSDQLTLWL